MGVLEERYASPEMQAIWSEKMRIGTARRIWIAVMRGQAAVDGPVTYEDIGAYEMCAPRIDLNDHRNAERITGHETMAWIEVFNEQVRQYTDGKVGGKLHLGMTSCDITENIIAWQVRESLRLVRDRAVAVLSRLGQQMYSYRRAILVGRTHGLPAQLTTLGKRMAVCGSEMLAVYGNFDNLIAGYPLRGVQGAVGNSTDMLELLGDMAKVRRVHVSVASELGFSIGYPAIGQTPPRAPDALVTSIVEQICSGPASMALTMRLMIMEGLATERPRSRQVGSSAMPHKNNPRYAERVEGLRTVVNGYGSMIRATAGTVWNEGDVSDSSTRRIALPGLFLAADGLLRSFMVALDRFTPDLSLMDTEVQMYRVAVSTGRILAAATRAGADRERAHAAIRQWGNNLSGMATDPDIPLRLGEIQELVAHPSTGEAQVQVTAIREWITQVIGEHYEAAGYDPGEML